MTNSLPDLSSWHPVPLRAVIPGGMQYARIAQDGSIHVTTRVYDTTPASGAQYFTRTRLLAPLPEVTLDDFVQRAEYLVQSLSDNTEAPLVELVRDLLVFLSKSADRRS